MTVNPAHWRPKPIVRAIALGVVWRGDEILVEKVRDDTGQTVGWRPLGGGIDFGEYGADALVREFMEELGLAIRVQDQIAALENLYVHHEARGHEIALIYNATFMDRASYEIEDFASIEDGVESTAQWKNIALFRRNEQSLFPQGLLKQL